MNADKLVVGIVGMPGSGKSLVVETAQKGGYSVVVMGDVIREETQKRGLELNPKNVGKVMLEMREKGGSSVIAEKCIPKILQQESSKVIVDGLRSLHEADAFKTRFARFSLMAVHASPETRFKRLYRRGRSDDPDGWELFYKRDARELSVGLGEAIAKAEFVILNEGKRETTIAMVRGALRRVERKWMK